MALNIMLIIVGFILLIKGADFLVEGSKNIAKKLKISEMVIGLTVVSIGTSMPELFVSVTSALNGSSDIALGNVIGSNLCNLLLILGISAIIRPIIFKKQTKTFDIPFCIFVTAIFIVLCNINNNLSFIDGIILAFFFLCFLIYTIILGKKQSVLIKQQQEDLKKINVLPNVIFIILGIVGLKFGGDFVVDNSIEIANALNISEKIISLTIVAIGTSLPELITSITAAIKGSSDIAIGNIIGSNIFNILLIAGLSSIIKPMNFDTTYNIQLIILMISTVVLSIFPYTDKKDEMTRSNGITYIMIYALYMVLLFYL